MPRAALPSGRKSLLLLALAAAIIGGAWWRQRPPTEPVHNGQRLSEWLADEEKGANVRSPAEQLRAFGPGTVPWLAYTVEHGRHHVSKPGPLRFDNAPDWLRRLLPERWGGLRGSWARDERVEAVEALQELGPDAAPAIPALVKSLEADDSLLAHSAAVALHGIGPASWPAVEDLLNHPTNGRGFLLVHMDVRVKQPASDPEVERAVRALVQACHDPDPEVRIWALDGISNCNSRSPRGTLFSPALAEVIRLLSDPQLRVRKSATGTIFAFGEQATNAIPRLIELLDDPDVWVRISAAESLAHLDRTGKRSAARLRVMALRDANPDCRKAAEHTLQIFGLSPEEQSASADAAPGQ